MNQPLIRSSYWYGLSNNGFHRLHYTDWGDEAGERVVTGTALPGAADNSSERRGPPPRM